MKIACLALSLSIIAAPLLAADGHKPAHGGQIRETAGFDLELVANDGTLELYVRDHAGKSLPTQGAPAMRP